MDNSKWYYYAHIRHINGDLLTTISDDNKARFYSEFGKAKKNLASYIQCDYNNNELYIEEVR